MLMFPYTPPVIIYTLSFDLLIISTLIIRYFVVALFTSLKAGTFQIVIFLLSYEPVTKMLNFTTNLILFISPDSGVIILEGLSAN